MRYLRQFSVLAVLSALLAGCRHRQVQATPPPQAQPPIVTTLPPMPPLTFPDVQLAKPEPVTPPVVEAAPPPPPPKKKHPEHIHHHRPVRKTEPDSTPAKTEPAAPPTAPATENTAPAASVLGQLSTDDAANSSQSEQTKHLIDATEARLKHVSAEQQAQHKDALVQVSSFLAQARQAWSTSDLVGAQTLANKAKILLDELLK